MSRIIIYDTTLRDGTQRAGISLSIEDKLKIARRLDDLSVDYIEGGWPGSNPKDQEFFARAREIAFGHARLVAFGSTRRPGARAADDANLLELIAAGTGTVTIVGKSSAFQVREVLRTSLDENLAMIADSVAFLKSHGLEVFYDAEHFFDGFRDDATYALQTLQAAAEAGADCLVLCDTNGGSMTGDITATIGRVRAALSTPLGIHTHNDCELAVANSLAAVAAGAVQVQGTINGYGERCGNANLCSIVPNLRLKLGHDCLSAEGLQHLTDISHHVAEVANLSHDAQLPYVGQNAFTHKAGMHANAVLKTSRAYEHVDPSEVGNQQRILVSELAGKSNVLHKARQYGVDLDERSAEVQELLEHVKRLESQGFQFEDAEASFELLVQRLQPDYRPPFELLDFLVLTEKRGGNGILSEATVKLRVDGETMHTAAEGNGPVNALDQAMRKALLRFYPELQSVHLTDYKVRVLDNAEGTAAMVRVMIESGDGERTWTTVGSSSNVIEASWLALADSLEYPLAGSSSNGTVAAREQITATT